MVSSEEYVRTARQVVFKIQRAVNKALVEGSDEPFHEDEIIDKLAEFAADCRCQSKQDQEEAYCPHRMAWEEFHLAWCVSRPWKCSQTTGTLMHKEDSPDALCCQKAGR